MKRDETGAAATAHHGTPRHDDGRDGEEVFWSRLFWDGIELVKEGHFAAFDWSYPSPVIPRFRIESKCRFDFDERGLWPFESFLIGYSKLMTASLFEEPCYAVWHDPTAQAMYWVHTNTLARRLKPRPSPTTMRNWGEAESYYVPKSICTRGYLPLLRTLKGLA